MERTPIPRSTPARQSAEIVEVLVGLIPIVGLPCVVAEAPKLAIALGYDTNDALEMQSDP